MNNYPVRLFTDCRSKKISKTQFIKQFSDWQKSQGVNYDCKGTADRTGFYVRYRGVRAILCDGTLYFEKNSCTYNGVEIYELDTARSFFEFRRKVDFKKNARKQKERGNDK